MNGEAKKKIGTVGITILIAICSGALSFAYTTIKSSGEYKNKVDVHERLLLEHETELKDIGIVLSAIRTELHIMNNKGSNETLQPTKRTSRK